MSDGMDEEFTERDCDALRHEKLVINVGGFRHITTLTTLKNIPDTRLSWLAENHPTCADYDSDLGEYFFDRHPRVFAEVLNYYRTGRLHCPGDICFNLFADELSFWGIRDREMEPCCWVQYKQHMNVEKNLKAFHLESRARKPSTGGVGKPKERKYLLSSNTVEKETIRQKWRKFRPAIWRFLDDPRSSMAARVLVAISSLFIVVSVTQFCLITVDSIIKNETATRTLHILHTVTSVWFTLELALRLIFCPGFKAFIRSPSNWIDGLALLPFYLRLGDRASFFSWLVVLRTLRIFKLMNYCFAFQVLLHTIAASKHELFMVGISLVVPVILFSSAIYFAEKDANGEMFSSVPESFWWAIVTVTTLGYGDVVPVTKLGKLIGALCAVCGVIIVALPVSVIGSSFSYYYRQARTRAEQPYTSKRLPALSHIPANLTTDMRLRRTGRRSAAGYHVRRGGLLAAGRYARKTSTNPKRRRKLATTSQSNNFEMSQMQTTTGIQGLLD